MGAAVPRRLPPFPLLFRALRWAAFGRPTVSFGDRWRVREGGRAAPGPMRAGDPAPLQVTRLGPLPAAPPPLVSSPRGGGVAADRGRGARPQAGCETTAAAAIDCAGASSGLGAWEHRERSSWERVRTCLLGGD